MCFRVSMRYGGPFYIYIPLYTSCGRGGERRVDLPNQSPCENTARFFHYCSMHTSPLEKINSVMGVNSYWRITGAMK